MKLLLAILQLFLILDIVINSRLGTRLKTMSELKTKQNELTYMIQSKTKKYFAKLDGSTGHFQIFSRPSINGKGSDHVIWDSSNEKPIKVNGIVSAPFRVIMQQDGNLVIYDKNHHATWSSNSEKKGAAPYTLRMQDDGNLVIYQSNDTPIWSSNSKDKK